MATEFCSQKIKALELRFRDGMFHAVFEVAGQMIEVALHGVSSLEDALQAIARLTSARVSQTLVPVMIGGR